MGANYSSEVSYNITENLFDMSTDIVSENLASSSQVVTGNQDMVISFLGEVNLQPGCSLNLSQNASSKTRLYQALSETKTQELQKELQNEIANIVTQTVAQANEKLNLGQANASEIVSYVETLNYFDLSTAIANKTKSEVNSQLNFNQSQKILFAKDFNCAGDANFSQNLDLESVMENVFSSDEVITEIKKITNQVTNKVDQVVSQKNEGIDPAMLVLAVMIPIIVIVAGVIGLVYAFKSGSFKGFSLSKNKEVSKTLFGFLRKRRIKGN